MDPTSVLLVLVAIVAAATAAGFVIRARRGRVRAVSDGRRDARLAVPGADLTLVQLSSPVCSACGVMRRVTEEIAAGDAALGRRELDVTEHPDLARDHSVLSTPTILLVDAAGAVRSRIIGAARPADVRTAIAEARAAVEVAA